MIDLHKMMDDDRQKLTEEEFFAEVDASIAEADAGQLEQTADKEARMAKKLGLLSDRFKDINNDFNDPLPEFEEYLYRRSAVPVSETDKSITHTSQPDFAVETAGNSKTKNCWKR